MWVDSVDIDGMDRGGYVWNDCGGDIHGDGNWDDDYHPTHWMPLPNEPDHTIE